MPRPCCSRCSRSTVLIAVQALGNLLVVAIVIAPGAAALRLSRSLPRVLVIAAAGAALAGVAGIYLSYWADLAAGASIALCAVALYLLSLTVRRPGTGARTVAADPLT